ncbi:MAG: sensor histidine kinase [Chloroflexota bacterium]
MRRGESSAQLSGTTSGTPGRELGRSNGYRLPRLVSLALPAAVWLLAVVTPPRSGLSPEYLATLSATLAALAWIDLRAVGAESSVTRRLAVLSAELALCFLIVLAHGTLIRPALIYLLPTSRSLVMFGERRGALASGTVWLAYGANVVLDGWPDRLAEYIPNYFSFFLAPYVAALAMTQGAIRQAQHRARAERLYVELQHAHQELRELHEHAREAGMLEERNRLAREIHDSVAHYLTVIAVQLETAAALSTSRPDEARLQLGRARELTADCLRELRHSVAALRATSREQLSLAHVLRKLVHDFSTSTGIAVTLDIGLDDSSLKPEAVLALYRVAQEGLTNVQRHSQSPSAVVELQREGQDICLRVRDHGRAHPAADGTPGGFGLIGLAERLALLGGEITFQHTPAAGASLEARVPAHG